MPYSYRKVRGKSCYKVYNKRSKKVFSKCSTEANALKQMRLLRAIENNKKFVPIRSTNRRRTQKGGRTWVQYFQGYPNDKKQESVISSGSSQSPNQGNGIVPNTNQMSTQM